MSFRIHSRSLVLKQVFIFCILSPLFLLAQNSIATGYAPFASFLLLSFLKKQYILLFLAFLSGWSIWNGKSWSVKLLTVFICFMLFVQAKFFIDNSDKVVLFLLFSYCIFALLFLVVWIVELSSVIYHPGFHKSQIGQCSSYPVQVTISFDERYTEQKFSGVLSNWDSTSCFILLDEGRELVLKANYVLLHIHFEGNEFLGKAYVSSAYGNALGFSLIKDFSLPQNSPSWPDFYAIMKERGIIHSS